MFFAFQGSFIFSVLWETGQTGNRLLDCSGQFWKQEIMFKKISLMGFN